MRHLAGALNVKYIVSLQLPVSHPKNTSTARLGDRLANKPHELIGCQPVNAITRFDTRNIL